MSGDSWSSTTNWFMEDALMSGDYPAVYTPSRRLKPKPPPKLGMDTRCITNETYQSPSVNPRPVPTRDIRERMTRSNTLFNPHIDLLPANMRYLSPDVVSVSGGKRITKYQVLLENPPSIRRNEITDATGSFHEIVLPWQTFSVIIGFDHETGLLFCDDVQFFVSNEQVWSMSSDVYAPTFLGLDDEGRLVGDARETKMDLITADLSAKIPHESSLAEQLMCVVKNFFPLILTDDSYLRIFDSVDATDELALRKRTIDISFEGILPSVRIGNVLAVTGNVEDPRNSYPSIFAMLDAYMGEVSS